ncbi:MAG TPA: XRE family transcriptional regulator [Bacteroidia bacterium]|nr:XRE family transcriptional regulator [Bacteroidia bacterium]
MKNNKLSSNLLILRQKKSISQDTLAKFLNISRTTITNYEGGLSEPDYEKLILIAKYFDISLDDLLTKDLSKAKSHEPSGAADIVHEPSAIYKLKTDKNKEVQSIPLYSIEVAAGIVQLFRDHAPTKEYITIPNLPKSDGALYVTGDSMYPLLKSGDIVIYKQINDIANCIFVWGEMYLICFQMDGGDYTSVKYIQKSSTKGYIKLVSQNKHHDDMDIPSDSIRALALVKASIRMNAM